MAEQIMSGSGTQFPLIINADGSINSAISGNIVIGSVTANVDSIYVQSGDNINIDNVSSSYLRSGTVTVDNLYAGSEVWEQNIYPGSKVYQGDIFGVSGIVEVDNLYTGSNSYIPAGSIIVTNRVAGSIVNMPTTTVTATDLDIRDLSSVSDSVTATISSPVTIGSYTTQTVDGTVTANVDSYLGSNAYIPAGSVIVTNNVGIANPTTIGSYTTGNIGSVQVNAGSIYVTNFTDATGYTGSDAYVVAGSVIVTNLDEIITGSEVWVKAGSIQTYAQLGSVEIWQKTAADLTVSVDSPVTIGSYTTQTVDGTVSVTDIDIAGSLAVQTIDGTVTANTGLYAGSNAYIPAGSVIVTNNVDIADPDTIGSYTLQNVVGSFAQTNIGSVIQSTNPWVTSGTSTIAGSAYVTGSINISTSLQSIGSWTGMVNGSMAITNIGSVIQSTSPWVISGNTLVSGTVIVSGLDTRIAGSIVNIPKTEVHVSGVITDFTNYYKQLIDYEGTYQPVYIGLALPGTGSETAEWMIRRYVYDNGLSVATLFGSGNVDFDKKWSDRSGTAEVYS